MKRILKNWNLFELVWLGMFSAVAIVLTVLWKDNLFGFTVFITGILCVVFAAKGNILTYVFGMYNTFGYAWLAYTNHLFGEMGLNLLFFVPMNVVGFIMWKKHMNAEQEVTMLAMNGKQTAGVILGCLAGILLMGGGLALIPSQNTPFVDAATNILSIAATILMVKRYREQWLIYIILNVFTVIMWIIRTVNQSPDGPLMIVMWSAYLINAVYGLYNWTKGSRQADMALQK